MKSEKEIINLFIITTVSGERRLKSVAKDSSKFFLWSVSSTSHEKYENRKKELKLYLCKMASENIS